MNLNEFSPEFQNKYFPHRSSLINLIKDLIVNDSDLTILGPPGCGKSTLILDLINEIKVDLFVKINCISNATKNKILSSIISDLAEDLPNCSIKDANKFSSFIENLKKLETEHNLQGKRFTIILDNIEKIDVSENFFTHLLGIKNNFSMKINIIFVGVSLKGDILLKNFQMSLVPKILIGTPSNDFLFKIIKNHLENEKNMLTNNASIEKFLNIFQGNFFEITKNIDILINMAQMLWKFYNFSNDFDEFQSVVQMLIKNPWLNEQEIRLKLEKIEGMELAKKDSPENMGKIDNVLLNMPSFPAIILIASYFGTHNPERSDRNLFRDYKGKSHKKSSNLKQNDGRKEKNLSFFRLIALCQSLMSLNEKFQEEVKLFDQSVNFYSQINDLIEEGYISKINKSEQNITKWKFQCNVESYSIKILCEKFNLQYKDFFSFE